MSIAESGFTDAVRLLRGEKGSFVSERGPLAPPSLHEMGVTQEKLDLIHRVAVALTYGAVANYIPALIDPEKVDPTGFGLVLRDVWGNTIHSGNIDPFTLRATYQSVSKSGQGIHGMHLGEPAHKIAAVLQTAFPFNKDQILDPTLNRQMADNLVNNSGAISSRVRSPRLEPYLEDGTLFDLLQGKAIPKNEGVHPFYQPGGLQDFMRTLTANPELGVDFGTYSSEFMTGFNNMAIGYRLANAGRFSSHEECLEAITGYFLGCSLYVSPIDITQAGLVIAASGMDVATRARHYEDGQSFFDPKYSVFDPDHAIRIENALNTAGMYEDQPIINLLTSGARATTMKSGVCGMINSIQPGTASATTYNPLLDAAGNSTYGIVAQILLNELLSGPSHVPVRLSPEELEGALERQRNEDMLKTAENVLALVEAGYDSSTYLLPGEMIAGLRDHHRGRLDLIDKIEPAS